MSKTALTLLWLAGAGRLIAGPVVSQTFTSGATIPVDSPVGLTSLGNFTEANPGDLIGGVTVDLSISGGYNGNLYAYLVSPGSTLVELMYEPGVAVNGFGASGPGMNITFSDAGVQNIQNETGGGVLTGTYHPSGNLSDFGTIALPGDSADGQWELFVADLASGGGASTLESWTLNITPVPAGVPEPGPAALVIFGTALAGLAFIKRSGLRGSAGR